MLDSFKAETFTSSLDDIKSEETKRYIQKIIDDHNLGSYKIGSNLIAYDQIAQLHKGESVITAQTTSDLKEFLGTENIKDANIESVSTTISNGMSSFSSVIADQTRALVNKIDEVIYTIKSNSTGILTSRMTDEQREEFTL